MSTLMMDLNTSPSLTECPSIDFDDQDEDQHINLNYLENYFDSLLNQLESELAYLQESSSFVPNLIDNGTTTNTTSTTTITGNLNITNSNNNSNHGFRNDTEVNVISDSNIINSSHVNLVNNHEPLNLHFNHQQQHQQYQPRHHHQKHLNHLHNINPTTIINSHDEADHVNHFSTIKDASNQQFKGDNKIISTQSTSSSSSSSSSSASSSSTTTTQAHHNFSSNSSLTKSYNQRESPLSFSNYSRSSFYENNDEISYNLLTASQIQRIIDYYKPLVNNSNNNVDPMEIKCDRKTKKTNGSSSSSNNTTNNLTYTNNLFGCDVNNIEKAYGGLTLPPFIENALIYLARYGINSVGIFRKSGVKSRIMALRQKLESMTGSNVKRKSNSGLPTTAPTTPQTPPTTTKHNNNNNKNYYNHGSPINGGSLNRHYNGNTNFNSSSSPGTTTTTTTTTTGIENGTNNYRLSSSYAAGDDFCVYDVADMVKMWLREIKPRPLITKEVIYAYKELMMNHSVHNNNNVNNNSSNSGPSPAELSLKITVLLSDSQRAILEIFLLFLSLFAANCEVNQMNSQNLAICFTPSLCECDSLTGDAFTGNGPVNSNLINNNNNNNLNHSNGFPIFSQTSEPSPNGLPRSADTEIIFDAQRCLQYLIDNCSAISMISLSSLPFSPGPTLTFSPPSLTATLNPTSFVNNLSSSSSSLPMKSVEPVDHPMDCSLSLNEQQQQKQQPCHENNSVNHLNPLMSSLSLSSDIQQKNQNLNNNHINGNKNGFLHNSPTNSSLINGGNLLPSTYESSITINAAPIDILKRILYQKTLFDPTVVDWRVVKQSPCENSDVFEYKVQSSFFLPLKTFTINRRWSFIENQPRADISSSPSPSRSFFSSLKKSKTSKANFKGIVLRETGYLYDSWWRIGTHGEGKCQLDLSIAVDLRGHSYYWYTNTFPAIIDWQLYQIKQSFLVNFIETKNFKSTAV